MIYFEICGINYGTVIPLAVSAQGQISTSTEDSNNNSTDSQADIKGVLMGRYNNILIPILVDNNGRIIL